MQVRGGKRQGAGRKKGSLTKRTQEVLAQCSADGIQPAEVMIRTMRHYWDKGDMDKAVAVAKEAAPYFHNRLAAVEHSGNEQKPVHIVTGVPHSKEEAEILMRMNGHARTQ